MPRYVAFLRGINLGNRRIAMSRLCELFEELEYEDVESFIASGNLIFTSKSRSAGKLEQQIAEHLEDSLSYQVDTFVRTAAEVRQIGAARVFEEEDQPGFTVNVGFLPAKLPAATAKKLSAIRSDYDAFRVVGREFYWLCCGRMSDSEIWNSPELKALKLPTHTLRKTTSLRKLIAKHLE